MALSLAGIGVTPLDRNERLVNRAAIAKEGNIHLGSMYADAEVCGARILQGEIR